MKQAFNPYLPGYEYIPDGELYVFDGRMYIYGSHDQFNGRNFCLNDYVCWSAPVEDPGNWSYEGVIYKRQQDPMNAEGKQYLYAPDVQKGPDGHVWGTRVGENNNFDPGVLVDDDGNVYLYSGFAPARGVMRTMMKMRRRNFDGSFCVCLELDMLTIKSEPVLVVPGPLLSEGTGYEEHAFFEASSIRKVDGRYYFIYSSGLSHGLCYAVSNRPDGGFVYGGTLISNGDLVTIPGRAVRNLYLF